MKTVRFAFAALTAAVLAHVPAWALEEKPSAIPGIRARLMVRASPVVGPLEGSGDQTLEFFGRSLPSRPAMPCTAPRSARVSEAVVVADGRIAASVSVAQGRGGDPSAVVHQAMVLRARLRPDGCGLPESLIPEIELEGPAQGLPDVPLVDGKARFDVTSADLLAANPSLFPTPRPLCSGDTVTIRHLFEIDGCWYESLFTVRNGAATSDGQESATIDGPIEGQVLTPRSVRSGAKLGYTFVFTRLNTTHTDVGISDFAGYCGTDPWVGTTLYLSLFQNALLPDSQVTGPGAFDVWLPDLNGRTSPGTGNRVVAQVIHNLPDGSGTGQLARSGRVWIDAVSSTGLRGRFDLMIGDDHVTGSFDAPTCSPWPRGADIP
jgi:hypothetical protein